MYACTFVRCPVLNFAYLCLALCVRYYASPAVDIELLVEVTIDRDEFEYAHLAQFRLADPGRSASLYGASTPFNNYF